MAVSWNKDQLEAIENTDKGVIVSAAAGSGKTAVLIERTIRLLTDEKKKISADKLLAVTFTKDAANQLKDKLSAALENKLTQDPSNEWIQKQQIELNFAKINTINAFCLDLVKNNMQNFDLQSGIKIIDDVEIIVILNEAVKNAFEYYFENEPDMMDFLIDKLTDNNQEALKNMVKDMYSFLRSLPFPDSWAYDVTKSLRDQEGINQYVNIVLDDFAHKVHKACKKSDYAQYLLESLTNLDNKNKTLFKDDRALLYQLYDTLKKGTWEDVYDSFCSYKFSSNRITLKSNVSDDAFLQETAIESLKNLRKEYMALIKDVANDIKKTGRNLAKSMMTSADVFDGLFKLCKKTEELAWETKVEKNALEFSDVEMMAIKLLVEKTENGLKRTELACEIVKNKDYEVILIDEFQDVNNLQDLIFKAISDTDDLEIMGKNVFVVGDVKQSIYRFRQSNPLLFINAKQSAAKKIYQDLVLVQLRKNYRSRKNIIDYVNFTFSLLMSREVGEIEYNEDEKLQLGANFKNPDFDTEILLIEDNSTDLKEEQDDEKASSENLTFEAEHYVIAQRIKEMCDNQSLVEDKGELRPCRPSDFCVLSRNQKDGMQIAKALEQVGLSAFSEESSGYMRSREIAVMISLLRVIDNPMQDVPLVSVMMSPVLGFSAEETAQVRLLCRNENGLYNKRIYQIINLIAGGSDENIEELEKITLEDKALEDKCIYADRLIKRLRFYASAMSLEHLIRKIYDETDFFAVASTFENSKQKRANLRLLLEYASSYENNSDGGVSGFLRYLDAAANNGSDFKQAVTVKSSSDSVIVKTIHKSKGLEFPFVFLCGLSKKFNLKDNSARTLFNERLGAGMKISDHNELSVTEPISYKALKLVGLSESLSEELRLLYVAMTRAKEKLFIALNLKHGVRRDLDDYVFLRNKAYDIASAGGINPSLVKECKSFAQWIYITLLLAKGNEELIKKAEIDCELPQIKSNCNITFKTYDSIAQSFQPTKSYAKGKIILSKVKQLREKYDFSYESDKTKIPAKMTVTEIVNNEKEKAYGDRNPEFYPQLPKLEEEIAKLTASEKGTYTHLFMELADFSKAEISVSDELDRLYNNGFFTKKEKDGVYVDAVKHFFSSEFYQRVKKSKLVMREKRFLIRAKDVNLSDKYKNILTDESMIQGIADCIFKENDGYVLVDYKTDNFKDKTELNKYQTQLELYKAALDLILDMPVKSCYIYSFKLCEGVEIFMA